ncbi:uncharacterized protein SCODWIG_03651 [Saccharomycodes ludwigii]|uniref:HORMA domain-containing protein n=1 Tax=Saccharomycodes ludwigii TaxID=36035 RepID=A0A376BCP1_9ASCO|nr:uncharacterized protein SCODWIG_03651 [Saccharomycodes ludwigii]
MSTLQQTKPQTKTSITVEQSQKLLQTLLTMSFGCLAYLRGLFPDDNFVDQKFIPEKISAVYKDGTKKQMSSIKVKTLLRGKSKESDIFLDWIEKSVFKCLKLKYLKGISLGIFLDKENPEDLIENYLFSFGYSDKENAISLKINNVDQVKLGLLDVRKAIQQLMRRFIILTQSLDPLPDKKYLSMRLLFNDNCPVDFQPDFFKDASFDSVVPKIGISTKNKLNIGKIDTSQHKVALQVLSTINENDLLVKKIDPFDLLNDFDNNDNNNSNNNDNDDNAGSISNDIENKSIEYNNNGSSTNNIANFHSKTLESQTTTKLHEYLRPNVSLTNNFYSQTQAAYNTTEIECECTFQTQEHRTITCKSCKKTVHATCYGNYSGKNIPACVSCISKNNDRNIAINGDDTKLLFLLRKTYRYILKNKMAMPKSVGALCVEIVGDSRNEQNNIEFFLQAIKIMLLDGIFHIDVKRRVNGAGKKLRSSDYVLIDIPNIYVPNYGELIVGKEYVWSFNSVNTVKNREIYNNIHISNIKELEQMLQYVKERIIVLNSPVSKAEEKLSRLAIDGKFHDEDFTAKNSSKKRDYAEHKRSTELDPIVSDTLNGDDDFRTLMSEGSALNENPVIKRHKISSSEKTLESLS